MYTIIDIETTGNGIAGNGITEISIFKYDGYDVVDEFTSLVNPEQPIPAFITGLTGIDDAMVRNAPTFSEIADQVDAITKDTIFVAHNVGFDYPIIKNTFKELGVDFSRKKLCTVRLSRKLMPGYNSYSLGKLCSSLSIPLNGRHRARGDAHATMLLFKKLLRTHDADTVFKSFLDSKSQELTMPPNLKKEEFDKLPSTTGIYYFKNDKGKTLYIGKAKNIKKRVLSHFYDKSDKEIQLCNATAHLDFIASGNELLALLMESEAIKKEMPEFNKAQKISAPKYGIFSYEDRNGIKHIAYNKLKMAPNAVHQCFSTTECRLYLETICEQFSLCPKYCHLQENVAECDHYKIKKCNGICTNNETKETYNHRVEAALDEMKNGQENYIIKEAGRTMHEHAYVLIQDGNYLGYSFLHIDVQINSVFELEMQLTKQHNTADAKKILNGYLLKQENRKHLISM